MFLIIEEEIFEYKNNINEINNIILKINKKVEEGDNYFSHLIVDGKEVYENHDSYLLENINGISEIRVICKSVSELTNDILLSTEKYINSAVPEIKLLAEEFYNTPTDLTWKKYDQLLEGLQWITHMIVSVDRLKHNIRNWNEYLQIVSSVDEELNHISDALEHKDYVLIADIIQYEIMDMLEKLKVRISMTIDSVGIRENLL
ncbi:hypothetical protein [Evansella cellulosilytica]|uniref:Uncharacterized protein n=1 Tax=Evansella cellulosilytica (strain ATCC 21833 / DSM 2522 / FERM P-1141 / JCM 9156 / N-4) TaxID=649639 RepID=E6TS90_EVAC2|nr:hypothetical protein [Evansella cellulosilytica]ADU31859.1 hypothetical protein Bcell_3618 [Evansella cellulosilytica DSM 2522]